MKKRFVVKVIASAVLAAALAVAPLVESAANINVLSVSASAATTCRRVTLSRSEYNSIKSHWNNKGVSYLGYDLHPRYAKKLAVIDMQNLLNKVTGTCLTVDGQYGSKSQAAVKQFQRMVGISADGLFGNTSFTKLMSYIDVSDTGSSASVPSFDGKKLQICSALNKNLVFDLEGGNSPRNETNICAYENHGGSNQIFLAKKEYTDSSGKEWYKLYPSNDTTGKYALNVNYGDSGKFNNLQTYASTGLYTNELFSFESDGTGTYHIAALCGGYIEVAGSFNLANVYRREGSKLTNSKNQQFYLSEVNNSASTVRLDMNKALSYADKYSNRRNTAEYTVQDSNGGNCANYCSQLLVAANLPQTSSFHGSKSWGAPTSSFVYIPSMVQYFRTTYNIEYLSKTQTVKPNNGSYFTINDIKPGDCIVMNGTSGAEGHIVFVRSVSGNRICFTGNTNDRQYGYIYINGVNGVLKTSKLFG